MVSWAPVLTISTHKLCQMPKAGRLFYRGSSFNSETWYSGIWANFSIKLDLHRAAILERMPPIQLSKMSDEPLTNGDVKADVEPKPGTVAGNYLV